MVSQIKTKKIYFKMWWAYHSCPSCPKNTCHNYIIHRNGRINFKTTKTQDNAAATIIQIIKTNLEISVLSPVGICTQYVLVTSCHYDITTVLVTSHLRHYNNGHEIATNPDL